MKTKISLLLAATTLASSLLATEVELQVVAGKNIPDGDKLSIYDDSTTIGVRSNFFLSTDNALQLAYDKIEDVNTANEDAHRFSVNYLHIARDNGSLAHPFVLFGGGYEDGVDEGQGFINLGVGMAVNITNRVSLLGEIKALRKNVSEDMEVNTNLGIGFMFGNEPKNVVIKKDCITEDIAPRLVKPLPVPVTDDKSNCVR